MFNNHLMKACLAAVFAIGLAACSSSDTATDTPPDPDPTPAVDLAAERADINTKISAANTAVTGLTDDASDAAIGAADTAVAAAKAAVMGSSVPDEEKSAFNTAIAAIEGSLGAKKTSIAAARKAAADATTKANAATGKAMHAALGPPDGADTTALDNATASLSAAGLEIDAATGAGALATAAGNPASVTLKAGDSVGSLGGWTGTEYALTTGTGASKVTNEAVVYTNPGSPRSQSFVEKYGDTTEYTASTRTYNVGDAADANIKASAFPTAGVTTFTGAQDLPGTYDGAPGRYMCSAADTCTATFNATGIQLSAAWTFVHDSGARVSTPDAAYLFFGWWVRSNSDGVPMAASAFTGELGDADGTGDTASGADLSGSATYAGKAAGQFAMSNPLDGTGSGGDFTADATLTANFGAIAADNENGVTGTIDNFMVNGSSMPWSVKLNRSSAWAADGAITGPTSDATVWSINGNEAPASGTWSGQMYDEMPGNAPGGDGSNVPTTVTGTFYSEFSTIGRMAGSFGADKQ